MREFTEQEIVRREKCESLRKLGIDPFGNRFDTNSNSKKIKETYESYSKELLEEEKNEVIIAGRIMNKRRSGKAGFMDIQDKFGNIQIYISISDVGESEYELYKSCDLGDIIGITGWVCKTNTGALTIHATKYTHLVKALKPLPDKFHGLTDVEERYRRRYVDLITNENSKRIAFLRPKIIRSIQNFMDNRGFVEVETPVLTTLLSGASARPFITHHNTQDLDMYLRIALELPLKRLLVGGMEAVYEIGRVFRNEGMDPKHNPEFTLMEAYLAYSDLDGMMELTESMFHEIAKVVGKDVYNWAGHEINLAKPFRKISMTDSIKEVIGIDFKNIKTDEEALKLAEEHHIELEEHQKNYGHIVSLFFEKYVEETLIEPTFLYEHPIEISPLTKKNPEDSRFVDRFELFIGGKEFANAYTELNDPDDQLERFENQIKERDLGNDEATDIDMDFIEALEYGMPPAGGIGYGIDRMMMLFTESDTIREVILFPTMKPRD